MAWFSPRKQAANTGKIVSSIVPGEPTCRALGNGKTRTSQGLRLPRPLNAWSLLSLILLSRRVPAVTVRPRLGGLHFLETGGLFLHRRTISTVCGFIVSALLNPGRRVPASIMPRQTLERGPARASISAGDSFNQSGTADRTTPRKILSWWNLFLVSRRSDLDRFLAPGPQSDLPFNLRGGLPGSRPWPARPPYLTIPQSACHTPRRARAYFPSRQPLDGQAVIVEFLHERSILCRGSRPLRVGANGCQRSSSCSKGLRRRPSRPRLRHLAVLPRRSRTVAAAGRSRLPPPSASGKFKPFRIEAAIRA